MSKIPTVDAVNARLGENPISVMVVSWKVKICDHFLCYWLFVKLFLNWNNEVLLNSSNSKWFNSSLTDCSKFVFPAVRSRLTTTDLHSPSGSRRGPGFKMSKKRGLSLEEKRSRMLDLFYERKDFFLLKELEKIAPKEKGTCNMSFITSGSNNWDFRHCQSVR